MWDKHQRVRQHSRRRAVQAAKARAARRAGAGDPAPRPVEAEPPAPADLESVDEPEEAVPETSEGTAPAPEEKPPRDLAGAVAWTALVLLSVLLGGFLLMLLFMLG